MHKPIKSIKKSYFFLVAVISMASGISSFALTTQTAEAACPAVDTSRGTVTSTINVPAAGTYKVWSRMQAASATNDSFIIQIPGQDICGIVVGDSAVPTSGWKWVDYRSGNTNNKITVNLPAGEHTVTMIGREDSVKVDKLLFLSDQDCVPEVFGDNCEIEQDTEAPTVSMTEPSAGSTVNGSVELRANATDNVAVTRVEFYLGDTLLGVGTQGQGSVWGRAFDSTNYDNGSYKVSALAFDAEGNQRRSSEVTFTIGNPVPDTTPPQLTILSPIAGGEPVSGVIKLSANASDENGVDRVVFKVDNGEVGRRTQLPYEVDLDTKTLSKGNHTVTMEACDEAGNCSQESVVINVNNDAPVFTAQNADFNNNREVDLADLTILIIRFGETVSPGTNGDVNGNGEVDLADLTMLIILFGDTY